MCLLGSIHNRICRTPYPFAPSSLCPPLRPPPSPFALRHLPPPPAPRPTIFRPPAHTRARGGVSLNLVGRSSAQTTRKTITKQIIEPRKYRFTPTARVPTCPLRLMPLDGSRVQGTVGRSCVVTAVAQKVCRVGGRKGLAVGVVSLLVVVFFLCLVIFAGLFVSCFAFSGVFSRFQ